MVKGNLNSPHVLNKKIKVCLRWRDNPPTCYLVYCMKENCEEHFEFMHHCVGNDMNKGNGICTLQESGFEQLCESIL